jgi:hypothetical protein
MCVEERQAGVVIVGWFWVTCEVGKACAFVDGSLGGTGHKEPPDSRPRHHPAGSAPERDGLEDPRLSHTIGNASHREEHSRVCVQLIPGAAQGLYWCILPQNIHNVHNVHSRLVAMSRIAFTVRQ